MDTGQRTDARLGASRVLASRDCEGRRASFRSVPPTHEAPGAPAEAIALWDSLAHASAIRGSASLLTRRRSSPADEETEGGSLGRERARAVRVPFPSFQEAEREGERGRERERAGERERERERLAAVMHRPSALLVALAVATTAVDALPRQLQTMPGVSLTQTPDTRIHRLSLSLFLCVCATCFCARTRSLSLH